MDPDPDPAIFVIDLQDTNRKFFVKVFLLISFWGAFTSFCKDKSQKEVKKTVGIKVLLIIFAWK
jgi:hypothetical protein